MGWMYVLAKADGGAPLPVRIRSPTDTAPREVCSAAALTERSAALATATAAVDVRTLERAGEMVTSLLAMADALAGDIAYAAKPDGANASFPNSTTTPDAEAAGPESSEVITLDPALAKLQLCVAQSRASLHALQAAVNQQPPAA